MTSLTRHIPLLAAVFACSNVERSLELYPTSEGQTGGASFSTGGRSGGAAGQAAGPSGGAGAGTGGRGAAAGTPSSGGCATRADCTTVVHPACINGRCVDCETSEDCKANQSRPYCNTATHICRQCTTDAECTNGQLCNQEGECEGH